MLSDILISTRLTTALSRVYLTDVNPVNGTVARENIDEGIITLRGIFQI